MITRFLIGVIGILAMASGCVLGLAAFGDYNGARGWERALGTVVQLIVPVVFAVMGWMMLVSVGWAPTLQRLFVP